MPPPVQCLLAGLLMWALHAWMPFGSFHFTGQHFFAAVLSLAGVLCIAPAIRGFVRAGTTMDPRKPADAASLVTGGLYQFSRNPMYFGLALILSSLMLWLGSAWGLLALALFVACIGKLQILPEERVLEEKFGDDYRAYRSRVRRWL